MNFSKVLLILKKEYTTRVQKKTFLLMTFLIPVLLISVMVIPTLISKKLQNAKVIQVVDESKIFVDKLSSLPQLKFEFSDMNIEKAKRSLKNKKSKYHAILHIPKNSINGLDKLEIYSENGISVALSEQIRAYCSQVLEIKKLEKAGIKAEKIKNLKKPILLVPKNLNEESNDSRSATVVGFALAFIIYFSILLYGSQIMLGIIEEKNNRIVEVIISSVKPVELMMGKIMGVALVGLTQFLIWIVLIVTLINVFFSSAGSDMGSINSIVIITQILFQQNWGFIISIFLFYFLGGFFMYSSMFAAAGSAVNSQQDAQQFTFPLTLPIIIAIIFAQSIINDPHGNLAVILSFIPLTSPVIVMIRLPFGIPIWQLVTSMTLLIGGFVFMTWVAARIYRIGILMYGKKPSFKDLGKWIFYKP